MKTLNRAGLPAAIFAALFCLTPHAVKAAAQTVQIGDPANPGALASALQSAYAGGARRIVIRPGSYTLPPPASGSTFALNGWKDAVISAYGVSFMMRHKRHLVQILEIE